MWPAANTISPVTLDFHKGAVTLNAAALAGTRNSEEPQNAGYVEPDRDDGAEVGGFRGDVFAIYSEGNVSRGGELVHEFWEDEGGLGGEVETCFFGSVRRWLLIPIFPD